MQKIEGYENNEGKKGVKDYLTEETKGNEGREMGQ